LYNNARNNLYDRLTDIVNREKSAVSAYVNTYHVNESIIINHLKLVRKNAVSIGDQGEITFFKLENDSIRLLIYDTSKNINATLPKTLQASSPMYLVLQGGSGCTKGPDYKGVEVFAAYTYVEELKWGIVAKIPVSEINRPFIAAAILVIVLSFLLLSICVFIFIRVTNPLIDQILKNEQELFAANKKLRENIEELKQTETKLELHEKSLLLKNKEYELLNYELKLSNEQLTEAKEKSLENERRLRELNATKDKLFFIIAHDLRSPFNSILGYTELVIENAKDRNDDESMVFMEIIHSSAKSTLHLLENLLIWAKSQTGQVVFKPEHFFLAPLIHEIIEFSTPAAKIKNISLNHIRPDLTQIYADKNMLQTVVRNLISNAIKFTNLNGMIDIFAEENEDQIIITVTDDGVGMDEKTLGNLFCFAENVSTPGTAREKGSGLGLILCKDFVERHGGKIWAESVKGKGSKFYISIPVNKS
jgi:signal transduction histidine kinase